VTSALTLSPKDTRRVSNFNIRVKLLRASEVAKDKSAVADKPAAAASKSG